MLFSLRWPFRSPFFRSMPASKYCFSLQSRAFFAPRAPSAKMNVCIDATILSISYTICCFLCPFHASSTFFYKISSYFMKIRSPPLVGSMILKAAQKQNHEKCAFYALQFGPSSLFLHPLLQPEICKIHWKNVYFSFMAPLRKLHLASSALSHGSEVTFPFFVSNLAWFVQKCSPPSVVQKRKLMQHMFR